MSHLAPHGPESAARKACPMSRRPAKVTAQHGFKECHTSLWFKRLGPQANGTTRDIAPQSELIKAEGLIKDDVPLYCAFKRALLIALRDRDAIPAMPVQCGI